MRKKRGMRCEGRDAVGHSFNDERGKGKGQVAGRFQPINLNQWTLQISIARSTDIDLISAQPYFRLRSGGQK